MARAYGFRVFIVEAYANKIKDTEPLSAESGKSLAIEIESLLSRISAKGTHRFETAADDNGNVSKPVRTATVSQVTKVRKDMIYAKISVGEEGSHVSATKPGNVAQDLEGWSPEASHQITFLFPKGKGSRFLLVTQTNYRRDPRSTLIALLRNESKIVRSERQEAESRIRREAKIAGEEVPKRELFNRILFVVNQAPDSQYLDELLKGADAATVTFKSTVYDSVGNKNQVNRVLQIKLRNENILDVGRAAGSSWINRMRSGTNLTQIEAKTEVADLLENRALLEEGEEERYESASISLHGKTTDTTTTISADTLRDAFTYPLSDLPPSSSIYFSGLTERISKIAKQEQIELETIIPGEAVRCLEESPHSES